MDVKPVYMCVLLCVKSAICCWCKLWCQGPPAVQQKTKKITYLFSYSKCWWDIKMNKTTSPVVGGEGGGWVVSLTTRVWFPCNVWRCINVFCLLGWWLWTTCTEIENAISVVFLAGIDGVTDVVEVQWWLMLQRLRRWRSSQRSSGTRRSWRRSQRRRWLRLKVQGWSRWWLRKVAHLFSVLNWILHRFLLTTAAPISAPSPIWVNHGWMVLKWMCREGEWCGNWLTQIHLEGWPLSSICICVSQYMAWWCNGYGIRHVVKRSRVGLPALPLSCAMQKRSSTTRYANKKWVASSYTKTCIIIIWLLLCADQTHLAREKAKADAEFYKAERQAESHKV